MYDNLLVSVLQKAQKGRGMRESEKKGACLKGRLGMGEGKEGHDNMPKKNH